jgi:hypothetical protein
VVVAALPQETFVLIAWLVRNVHARSVVDLITVVWHRVFRVNLRNVMQCTVKEQCTHQVLKFEHLMIFNMVRMRTVAVVSLLILVFAHPQYAQKKEDTILLKYFEKAGLDYLLKISTFAYFTQGFNKINADGFFNIKEETESVFFCDFSDEFLTRNEIRTPGIHDEDKCIVFLKNDKSHTISHVRNNEVIYFNESKNYEADYLHKGYGQNSFMICMGIYLAHKANNLAYVGEDLFDGHECYKFHFEDDLFITDLYLEKDTYLLKGSKYQQLELNIDGTNLFKCVYKNPIVIEGILVPTLVTVYKNGEFWYSIRYKDVIFNLPLKDELFYDALEKNQHSFYYSEDK